MASKKKSKPIPKRAPKARWVTLPTVPVKSLVPVGVLLAVLGLGLGLVQARIWARTAWIEQASPRLIAGEQPEWITEPLLERVSADLQAPIARGDATAESIGRRLESSSWIRSARVQRTREGFLADVDYREPRLGVACAGGCCYTDRDGVALDTSTLSVLGGASCLTLRGVSIDRPVRPGERLPDPAVRTAGSLAERIADLSKPLRLVAVEIERTGPRKAVHLALVTREGGRIIWGPSDDRDPQKAAELAERARIQPMIPAGEVVNLDERPLATQPAPIPAKPGPTVTLPQGRPSGEIPIGQDGQLPTQGQSLHTIRERMAVRVADAFRGGIVPEPTAIRAWGNRLG